MNVLRACVVTAVVTTTLSLGASIALFARTTLRAKRATDTRGADVEIRALDKGDGATYASTYTVDGQFGNGTNATKGREALSKLVVRQPAAGEPPRAPLPHGTEPLDRVRGQGPCSLSCLLPDRRRRVGTRDAAATRRRRAKLR